MVLLVVFASLSSLLRKPRLANPQHSTFETSPYFILILSAFQESVNGLKRLV